jgi:RimJ/RimL family protein N-acetyltransferase
LLETERLVLRKPRLDDAEDVLECVGDPDVMGWIGRDTGDLAATVEMIELWLARWEENGVGPFAVLRDGRFVGRVGFLVFDADVWRVSSYAAATTPSPSWAGCSRRGTGATATRPRRRERLETGATSTASSRSSR